MTDPHPVLLPGVGEYLSALVDEPLTVLPELRDHIVATAEESIHIHPTQGRLLEILIRLIGARRVLELGTHLGYSAIWFASACDEGARIETIENDPDRHRRATAWIERSGFADRIEQILGSATEVMQRLDEEAYDLIFIDANKTGYPEFLTHAIRCVRPGGLIVADNTLHKGRVTETPIRRATSQALDAYNHASHEHPQLISVLVPLGDGLTISMKTP